MKTVRFREDLEFTPIKVDWFEDDKPGRDGRFKFEIYDKSDGYFVGSIEYLGLDETSTIFAVRAGNSSDIPYGGNIENAIKLIAEESTFMLESKESKRTDFIKTVAGELVLKLMKDGKSVDDATEEAVEIGSKLFDNIYKQP